MSEPMASLTQAAAQGSWPAAVTICVLGVATCAVAAFSLYLLWKM